MRAVNGILENGRFTPFGSFQLPPRTNAILVIQDAPQEIDHSDFLSWKEAASSLSAETTAEEKDRRIAWLNKLDEVIGLSMDEYLPDVVRSAIMREPLNLAD